MLSGNTSIQSPTEERRAESHKLIEDLMHSRTSILALYSRLADRKPFEQQDHAEVFELLEEFCQLLIDYTAAAHFRLYRYVDENKEKRRAVLEVAERIYPRICEITQTILDFNDRYDQQLQKKTAINTLEKDLSSLGVDMAQRIELEDQLIHVMNAPRTRSGAGLGTAKR